MDLLTSKIVILFYLSCFFTFGDCSEPHCSKFHYEENLLEKMVRIEYKLERMEKGFNEIKSDILEEKQKVQSLGESILKQVKDETRMMNDKIQGSIETSSTKLVAMEKDIKNVGEKMVQDVTKATSTMELSLKQKKAKLMRMSADLRVFQNVTMSLVKTPDVFFMVKDLVNLQPSGNMILKFKTIVENRGDGYNGNGIFTAPVDGDCIFTAQLCHYYGNFVYFTLIVDDVEQNRMALGYSKNTCGTATLLIRLKTGARVALKNTTTSHYYTNYHRWNIFSGYLLRKYHT